ncbi:MAG TPA: hypothetical protein VFD13_02540 [Candidatus Kapabacteria bacterium]|nr:hypothetical protein [Candidatus Kapabacteria bacterium]
MMTKPWHSALSRFIIHHLSFIIFFALVFPNLGEAQLSHLDSVIAINLGSAISQQVGNRPFTIAGEGSIQSLILAIPHSVGVSPIVQIASISGKIDERDLRDGRDSSSITVLVDAHGTVITPGNSLEQPWAISRTFDISLTAQDRMLLETNQDRYVSLEQPATKSFWASTLEPALVVVGALVIVALFFIIRS